MRLRIEIPLQKTRSLKVTCVPFELRNLHANKFNRAEKVRLTKQQQERPHAALSNVSIFSQNLY